MAEIHRTERLELRPLQIEFAAALLPIWQDENVVRYTYISGVTDRENAEKRIQQMRETAAQNRAVFYAIFRGEALIGLVGATRQSAFEYAIFYHLGAPYWGQGYATEAAQALIDDLFRDPAVTRISADAVTVNGASMRVLEKLGMTREGCQRQKFRRDNTDYDLYLYSLLREEYRP